MTTYVQGPSPATPPAKDVLFLETLLEQAQELRPEITVVRTEGCLFADGYKAVSYRAEAPGGQLWMGDTVDELLADIRDNEISVAA